ncbi:protein still life, isoform SIF type 1-like [Diadema antillarum]|uniref:protein still life, isoform SIF type 1-like n=1 Tax=Diadema antillarum TaxID=105358 RepID=UPI003A86D64F
MMNRVARKLVNATDIFSGLLGHLTTRPLAISHLEKARRYSPTSCSCSTSTIGRLLAQVYSLFVDGEEQQWERVIDEVVRISVIVEQEEPKCIYRVTASDTELQGIIEAYITLPGTQLVRCTPTFVQWKDPEQGGAWGLNFVLEDEAEKFINLCSN